MPLDKWWELDPPAHALRPGDRIVDLTAERKGWPDVRGIVEKLEGYRWIWVRYDTGNLRRKVYFNLRKEN